jgi:hypothetical protein
MKKALFVLIALSILSSSAMAQTMNIVSTSSGTVFTGTSHLKVNLVNQNPLNADPGSYVDLTFKVENNGTDSSQNTTLELVPQYPFYLDPGVSPVVSLGTVNGLQSGNNALFLKYHVRVDSNAVNGNNEIKLKQSEGTGTSYLFDTFNVSVSNPRTDFEVIAQDSSTLAIANTGSNVASAVIVSIPQQQNFSVSGASSNIIGSLNAGDYTLAAFQITSTASIPRNFTRGAGNVTTNNASPGNITVDISYTDILGIRRTVEKSVPFVFSGNATTGTFVRTGQSSALSSGILYIIIGVVGIVVIVAFIKLRTRKKK